MLNGELDIEAKETLKDAMKVFQSVLDGSTGSRRINAWASRRCIWPMKTLPGYIIFLFKPC